jgi:hypothetical protein
MRISSTSPGAVMVGGRAFYTHAQVDAVASGHRGRGDLFAAVRSGRIPAPGGDGNTHLWDAAVVDAAAALYEVGADGRNGFGFDRDGYGPDGRHGRHGGTREELEATLSLASEQLGAFQARRDDEQQRAAAAGEAAILKLVDQALISAGKRRSGGDWGWVATVLGGADVALARVPRDGACRRCSRVGTGQSMPKFVWWHGSWEDFDQCGSCGAIGNVGAPYRIIEAPTLEKLVAAVRELAS